MPTKASSGSVSKGTPVGESCWLTGRVHRFDCNPIVSAATPGWRDPSDADNINGPSVVRVPPGTPGALATYYMYFAHHSGKYIRLAHASDVEGPWSILPGGVLPLTATGFDDHVASPDVVIDPASGQWRMYFHGESAGAPEQTTRMAVSPDGLTWEVPERVDVAPFYLRAVCHGNRWYGVAKNRNESLFLLRSDTGLDPWEVGPEVIPLGRHVALEVVDGHLVCFYSRIGDAPEQLLVTAFDLSLPWEEWASNAKPETLVLAPAEAYEGVEHPVAPSSPGSAVGVRQLRDPHVLRDGKRRVLFYSAAGEESIAAAELHLEFTL